MTIRSMPATEEYREGFDRVFLKRRKRRKRQTAEELNREDFAKTVDTSKVFNMKDGRLRR